MPSSQGNCTVLAEAKPAGQSPVRARKGNGAGLLEVWQNARPLEFTQFGNFREGQWDSARA